MQIMGARVVGTENVVDIDVGETITDIRVGSARAGIWVMPGLWDHHIHATEWASAAHRLNLSAAASASEALALVTERVRATPRAGGNLIGSGMWHSRWARGFGAPGGPTQADLDAVTGPVPTILISADLHSAWFNSAAASRYDLLPSETGLVVEEEWFARLAHINPADAATIDAWVLESGRQSAARGVTGVVDFDSHDTHGAWRRRVEAGFDSHRVRAAVWPEHLDAALAAGLHTGDLIPGAGPLIRMGPLKVISDGSLNTRTAWCHHPYPDGSHGAPNLSGADLTNVMARARSGGIESAVHAIGDLACEVALDAFAATGARGTLEHAQLLTDADVARLAALGVAASVQPAHLLDDRNVAENLWAGRTRRAFRFADLLAAGVELRLGSDAPVAPLEPWLAIAAAVTRTADDRPAWHGDQRIDRISALRASTNSRIRVSEPADLVILGADPLAVPIDELAQIPVLATYCAGRLTHSVR